MSEWLQTLGKKSLTSASDISDTNYEEFERLEHDGVKEINAANDEFQKTVEEQAQANIRFYNAYHANKFNQYQSLADLTQTGATLATKGLQMNETRKFYDEGYDHYNSEDGIAGDKYVKHINTLETALHLKSKEAKIINGKDIVKEEFDIFERSDFSTLYDQLTVLVEDKNDARTIGTKILPSYYESAFNIPVLVEQEDGTSILLSYNNAVKLEDKAKILDTINVLFLADLRSKSDYNEGFIRKYITAPMYAQRDALLNEATTALGKAKGVATARIHNEAFYQNITSDRES